MSTVTRGEAWAHHPFGDRRRLWRRSRRSTLSVGSTREDGDGGGDDRRVRLLREAYEKLPIREVVGDVSRALEVRR
jgi:hypothetical protein